MAKDKERSINPAQQQRKAEKAKALKKAKSEQQTRRNEKLARRNPDRIQRQIDDLKALESSGDIKAREKSQLEELERDLRAVRKAREALGEKAPHYGGSNRQPPSHRKDDSNNNSSILGKRQHNGERIPPRHSHNGRRPSSGSDTDDSVRRIPMPEDTPPPIPREHKRYFHNQQQQQHQQSQPNNNTSTPNLALPTKPLASQARTTYSAAPQIRDLKKEATSRFVPDVVRRKQDAVRGQGGLVEPEEMDRLEAQGYYGPGAAAVGAGQSRATDDGRAGEEGQGRAGDDEEEDDEEARRLAEEEARFEAELGLDVDGDEAVQGSKEDAGAATTPEEGDGRRTSRNVQMEEVEDEDA